MKLIKAFLVVSILNTPLMAFSAPNTDIPVVVNGEILSSKAKKIGGAYYINVKDISELMSWKYKSSPSAISIITESEKSSATATQELAEIKGTATYYFNSNYGAKPDTGAQVFIISSEEEIYLSDEETIYSYGDNFFINFGKPSEKKLELVSKTVADGNGSFSIKGIKPSSYILFIRSSHSKGMSLRDIRGKVHTRRIKVGAGENLDVSHDFGTTAL